MIGKAWETRSLWKITFLFFFYYIQPPTFRIASVYEANRILVEKNELEMGQNFKVFQLINFVVYVTKNTITLDYSSELQ